MRKLYSYDVARSDGGQWRRTLSGESSFSREPEAVARGLLERWVISQQDRAPSGRVVVTRRRSRRTALECTEAVVRVRVFAGSEPDQPRRLEQLPVATAYLATIDA